MKLPIETPDRSTFGDQALEPMHLRLVDYGLCWLRGGASHTEIVRREIIRMEPGQANDTTKMRVVSTSYRDPDLDRQARKWTPAEIEAAARLHSRIIRLPLAAQSLALQVFYSETIAAEWVWIEPAAKAKILRDLTTWPSRPYGVNARLARRARELGRPLEPIRVDRFIPIMLSGMRMLVRGEA